MRMKIAVVNEVSACSKNPDIINALDILHADFVNIGMTGKPGEPELTYIDTGFLAALMLNAGRADFVIGGCGTGQGFLNAAMQYPHVFCGLADQPLDAWLFAKINGGNCLSLALNKGYGWAGDMNLLFLFDRLFQVEMGTGFPASRAESQKNSREQLKQLSDCTHKPFAEIVAQMDSSIVRRVLQFPGVRDVLQIESLSDVSLAAELERRMRV